MSPLQIRSQVGMQPCDTVAGNIHYLAHPMEVLKYLKLPPLNMYGNLGMHRRMPACTDEFLATATEGVVHGVYKVVTQSSVGVTERH